MTADRALEVVPGATRGPGRGVSRARPAVADAAEHALRHDRSWPRRRRDQASGPAGAVAVALAHHQPAAVGAVDGRRRLEDEGPGEVERRLVAVLGYPSDQGPPCSTERAARRRPWRPSARTARPGAPGRRRPGPASGHDPVDGVDAQPGQVLQRVVGVEAAATPTHLHQPRETASAGAATRPRGSRRGRPVGRGRLRAAGATARHGGAVHELPTVHRPDRCQEGGCPDHGDHRTRTHGPTQPVVRGGGTGRSTRFGLRTGVRAPAGPGPGPAGPGGRPSAPAGPPGHHRVRPGRTRAPAGHTLSG